MAGTDIADLKEAATSLAATQRELTEAIQLMVDRSPMGSSASTVTIHAGGISTAIAVCIAISGLIVSTLIGMWMQTQLASMQSEQRAWVQVITAKQQTKEP